VETLFKCEEGTIPDEGEEIIEDGEEKEMENGREKMVEGVSPFDFEDTMMIDEERVQDVAITEMKESGTSGIGDNLLGATGNALV
jgi:hypothetical protein